MAAAGGGAGSRGGDRHLRAGTEAPPEALLLLEMRAGDAKKMSRANGWDPGCCTAANRACQTKNSIFLART
jgi:hypothetical protein